MLHSVVVRRLFSATVVAIGLAIVWQSLVGWLGE